MSKIIAVDFDGTLCENQWPDIGAPNHAVLRRLRRAKVLGGAKLILWTCRTGEQLKAAVEWCKMHGIVFDAVNANLPENVGSFGHDCRKVFAHEYWDDRAVRVDFAED